MLKFLEGLNWLAILSFLVAVEIQITNGTISFTHWLPAFWIDRVKEMAGDLATIGALIVGGGSMGRVPGSQVIKVAAMVLVGGLLFAGEARAQSLPVKAPAATIGQGSSCTPTSCTGFYFGGGLGGLNNGSLDIIGSGINGSVFAGGAMPAVQAGYIYRADKWLFGGELGVGELMNSGVNVNGVAANNNGLFSWQVIRLGGDVSGLLGVTVPPITIPPQLASSLISLYGQVGTAEKQMAGYWATGMVSGGGAFFDVGAHLFFNLDYKHVALTSPASALIKVGNLDIMMAGLNYKF